MMVNKIPSRDFALVCSLKSGCAAGVPNLKRWSLRAFSLTAIFGFGCQTLSFLVVA